MKKLALLKNQNEKIGKIIQGELIKGSKRSKYLLDIIIYKSKGDGHTDANALMNLQKMEWLKKSVEGYDRKSV